MMPCLKLARLGGVARNGAAAIFAALMAGAISPAGADSYPDRPIQLVVPAGPGSSTDTIMRSLAQAAAPLLGQSIVILNKPGASGTIGVGYVTRSEPDGYTIGGCRAAPSPWRRMWRRQAFRRPTTASLR
jgi:tripartite-type tricarboxylate transporter receptor subunit TctC